MPSFYDPILANLTVLTEGAAVTLEVSLIAIGLGVIGGMTLNFMQLGSSRLLKWITGFYISIFRGIPILLQLLMAYYVPSAIGINLNPLTAAILALALNTSAFQAEIYRGGFASLPIGQIEAARSVGMNRIDTFLRIQAPQVIRLVLPSLFNEVMLVLKASSLVSVIAVTELTRRAQQIASATQAPIQIYLTAAVLYIVMNAALAFFGRVLERKVGVYKL